MEPESKLSHVGLAPADTHSVAASTENMFPCVYTVTKNFRNTISFNATRVCTKDIIAYMQVVAVFQMRQKYGMPHKDTAIISTDTQCQLKNRHTHNFMTSLHVYSRALE